MESRYSSIIDPSAYDSQNLCDGIQPRLHNDHQVEDLAILRAHEDWRENVGPIDPQFRGCLHPRHSFVSLCMPECLPERLDIVCYANEVGFLHDDIFENAEKEKGEEALNSMIEGFQEESSSNGHQTKGSSSHPVQPPTKPSSSSGKKLLQSKLVLKMLSLDRERALTAINMWTAFLELGGGGRGGENKFDKLDDYINYRIEDVGKMTWSGLLMFGCGITIPEQEKQAADDLCRSAWVALSLTNDLFSWDKEQRDAVNNTGDQDVYVSNALCVIMREHPSMDLEGAKDMCRTVIRASVSEYLSIVERTKRENGSQNQYSLDLLRFMDGLVYSIGGNLVWSLTCPRYNAETQLSDQQLEWIKNGIPDYLRRERAVEAPVRPQEPEILTNGHTHTNGWLTNKRPATEQTTTTTNGNHPNGISHPLKKQKANGHSHTPSDPPPKTLREILASQTLPPLSKAIIEAPSNYIASLPGKGVRSRVIDALNIWFQVPESKIIIIKKIIDLLHQASMMLDDMQDSSPLRRGRPATHTVFGCAQTINSSSYKIAEALEEVLRLDTGGMGCMRIVIEESKWLYIGQSLDLHWTGNLTQPSVAEYIKALDDKTGGLIRMLTRLLEATSPLSHKPDVTALATMLGRCYGLRDDYKNISSAEYTQTKGFCEDLDEGKFSLPIIHALETLQSGQGGIVLRNILTQRRVTGAMTLEHKRLVLELLDKAGSLPYTLEALRILQDEVDRELDRVEAQTGVDNWELRAVIEMIKV